MAKVLFFNIPARGHTNPTLAYVEELVRHGEQVVYYSINAFRESIEATGAEFRSYGEALPREPDGAPTNFLRLAEWILHDTQQVVAHFLDEVRQEGADYIIHDALSCWGRVFAQLLGVPAIASVTTFAFSPITLLACPRFALELASMVPPAWSSVRACRRIARDLQKEYGIPRIGVSEALHNRESTNIVYTARQFQPGASAFNGDFKFVGPSISTNREPVPFPFEELEDRPLVYASLGTVTNDRPDFFRSCVDAFAGLDADVVVSVGSKVDPASLGEPPDGCILARFVPQLEILQRASVFVTHGGMNSVNEGLYFGVPLVVAPQMAEQALVGRCVERAGAGICLGGGSVTPERLRAAVERVLMNGSCGASARILQGQLQAAGGPRAAFKETQAFKRRHAIRD